VVTKKPGLNQFANQIASHCIADRLIIIAVELAIADQGVDGYFRTQVILGLIEPGPCRTGATLCRQLLEEERTDICRGRQGEFLTTPEIGDGARTTISIGLTRPPKISCVSISWPGCIFILIFWCMTASTSPDIMIITPDECLPVSIHGCPGNYRVISLPLTPFPGLPIMTLGIYAIPHSNLPQALRV